MIKRTLLFASRGSLRLHYQQLVWQNEAGEEASIPIEDIGFLILESPQITLTTALLQALSNANVATIVCDETHHPTAYYLPEATHTLAHRLLSAQIALTEAQRNRLWKHLMQAKIRNQSAIIMTYDTVVGERLYAMAERVKNGDPENLEAQAARLYFYTFSKEVPGFLRDRFGDAPNGALNYGYAILRAAVARACVSSGLCCSLGIHHDNQYNPFVLADDVMEPYRPFIDQIVLANLKAFVNLSEVEKLTPTQKKLLLPCLTMDVNIEGQTRPLMNALSCTTASLARYIASPKNEHLNLSLPEIIIR